MIPHRTTFSPSSASSGLPAMPPVSSARFTIGEVVRHRLFAFRGVVSPDQQPAGIPDGYERLIAPFRMRRL